MPPSRFAALSPWRNLVAKPTQSYSEVPMDPTTDAVGGNTIAALSRYVYVKASTAQSVTVLEQGEEHTGKLAGNARQIPMSKSATDIAVSPFNEELVAIGAEDGYISILKGKWHVARPYHNWHEAHRHCLVRWHPHASNLLLSASSTSSQLHIWAFEEGVLVNPAASHSIEVGAKAGGKFLWDVQWSNDGSKIIAALADGTIKVLNARDGATVASSSPPSFGLPKPMRVAHVGAYILASTLNSSRQKELRIYTFDSLSAPIHTITLDTASSPLALAVDQDRRLVFMGAKGDVSIRWIELDDARKFPQGAFPLPPRTSFASLTLAKPACLNVMAAEINRLYVASASGSEVIPISIEIPQRQLIDYHAHLYPDTYEGVAALTAAEWLAGKDGERKRVSMDPSRRHEWAQPVHSPFASPASGNLSLEDSDSQPSGSPDEPAESSLMPPTLETTGRQPSGSPFEPTKASTVAPPTLEAAGRQPSGSPFEPTKASTVAPVSLEETGRQPSGSPFEPTKASAVPPPAIVDPAANVPKPASPLAPTSLPPTLETTARAQQHTTSSSSTTKRPNITSQPPAAWSRATLGGSTPLLSAFTSVPAVDSSVSPASRSFLATPSHLIYPLAGPGGRLAFHELARSGRLPEAKDVSWIETGGKVFDFASDPFDSTRVITMAEDGVKVWRLPGTGKPESEYEQCVVTTPKSTVALPSGLGRGSNVAFHPTAADVLLMAGSDGLAVVDLTSAAIIKQLADISVGGEVEWSPNGSLVAFARSSDRKLVVWNPHTGATADIGAHDSPRPFKIAWLDEGRVITVGHTFGSMRQVKLFGLTGDFQLKEEGKLGLDTSPALLFPHYDGDAGLLYLWSKGERSVSVLHVTPPSAPQTGSAIRAPIFKLLPGAFQHSQPQVGVSFLPKRYADVREVEVAVSYRLSKNNEIQRVGWRAERKRKEFFQDDVFPHTVDVETPTMSAAEWAQGSASPQASRPTIDLCPPGMTRLSDAPPPEPTNKSSLPKAPTQKILDEKEREDQLMSGVFARAKIGGSNGADGEGADELEQTAAGRRAPDNDDWGDDD